MARLQQGHLALRDAAQDVVQARDVALQAVVGPHFLIGNPTKIIGIGLHSRRPAQFTIPAPPTRVCCDHQPEAAARKGSTDNHAWHAPTVLPKQVSVHDMAANETGKTDLFRPLPGARAVQTCGTAGRPQRTPAPRPAKGAKQDRSFDVNSPLNSSFLPPKQKL